MAGKGRIKGITIELGGDATGLEKALGSVDKSLGATQKSLNDINRLLKLDPQNVELLEQKQRLLSKSVQDTSDRLDTLKKASEQAAKSAEKYDEWKAVYDPIQSEIDQTKEKLRELKNAQKESETSGNVDSESYIALQNEIDETNRKLRDLKTEAQNVKKEFGSPISSSQYDALQREIIETEQKFNSLQNEADQTTDSLKKIKTGNLDDVRKTADQAEESLDDASKSASHFGDVLSAELAVSGIKEISGAISDITEATKEYDRIMASLDVSSQKAGYTADETAQSYQKLYGVLGDDQTSATTLSNLQQIGFSQDQLNTLINGAVGAWATYGDSIPIDGLAEAVNETIRTGTVTGNLADVLNWGTKEGETFGVTLKDNIEFTKLSNKELEALTDTQREEYEARKSQYEAIAGYNTAVNEASSAEDFFNLALQETGSEAERANKIMQLFADQGLITAGEQWQEQNSDIVEANKTQAEFTENMSQMSEKLTPVVTEVKDGVNDLLGKLIEMAEGVDLSIVQEGIQNAFDFLINTVIPKMQEFWTWLTENINWAAIGEGFSTAFDVFVNQILPIFFDFLKFVLDNKEIIISALVGIAAAIATVKFMNMANEIMQVINGTKTLTSIIPGLGNVISFLSNPIALIVGVIAAAVAFIALKGDEIQAVLQKVDDFLQNIFAMDWREIFGPVLGEILNAFFKNVKDIWDSIKRIFDGIIDFIRGVFTGDWERAWNGVKNIFGGIFDGLVALAKSPINMVIGIINAAINGINGMINGINKININVPDWVPIMGGKSFGFNISNIPNIPMLAKGGVLSSGSAIVGEAGPELLTMSGNKAVVQPLTNQTTNHNFGETVINVYGAPGQNVNELARIVSEKISADIQRKGAVYA